MLLFLNVCKQIFHMYQVWIYQKVKGVLTILTQVKTVFYSIEYKNGCLAASDIFHMLTLQLSSYTFHYHALKSADIWKKVIHQIDSKKKWLLLSAGFTAKFVLVFVLTLGDAFS